MKKLTIIFFILSHSFLAMADDNATKVELLNFIKENNVWVGTGIPAGSYFAIADDELTIDSFDKFTTLIFRDLNITKLPQNISTLPNLSRIVIENMNLDSFPKINTLQDIRFLNVDFHKIEDDVLKNENLIVLFIDNCNLKYLSKNIGNLNTLWYLDITNNNLTELPNEIGNLTNLQSFHLKNNQLTSLPKEFENLTNLYDLGLTNNKIEELPNTLINLKYLRMANNKLKELPENFGDAVNLQYLDLSNNELKSLPDSFVNLKNLEDLYLNNNQIEKLPKDFFTIFQLKHPSYGNYRSGAFADIAHNRISFFDKSICEMFRLEEFHFDSNYFDSLPICLNSPLNEFSEFDNIHHISSISNIYGNQIITKNINSAKDILEQAGWQFAEDIIIYYTHEDNKTIKLEPIYQIDMNIKSYLWNFSDGNTSTDEIPTHTYQNYGDYNVTLTINDDKTFSKLITISPRTLELKKGWNMITPPTKDDINASLFNETWSYQNEEWINNHEYLIPTVGYWVKLNEDLNYSYKGEVYELPNYKIKSGWNFLGSGEKYYKNENHTIYQFKNGKWIINPNEIKRGDGFWIKK